MNWYYAEGGSQRGPVTGDEFGRLLAAGAIGPDTLVWREGMTDWRPYHTVAPGSSDGDTAAGAAPAADGTYPTVTPQFTGTAEEYFKIWIVNLLLTVVTLGIYAAWAKVRTKRYFYANTHLLGHAFEYLADPVKIFFGNMIVVAFFFALNYSPQLGLMYYFIFLGLFLVAVPWFIVRALSFNARNSAWRGLRFHFHGRYGEAFLIFGLLQLLIPLSLGLAFPWVAKKSREWVVRRHSFGTSGFAFTGRTEDFYRIYLVGFLFFLPLLGMYVALFAIAAARYGEGYAGALPSPYFFLVMLPALFLAFMGTFYIRARLFNYSWAHTTIGPHRFDGTMDFGRLLGLHFTNLLATFFTFGLMYPWARVRLARYTASCLQVTPGGSLDQFVAAAQQHVGALGEAASDFFDLDVGIDFGL